MVNNFTVCQNPYNDFAWWHKNILTTIFLLLYLLLPLRIGPTCHRIHIKSLPYHFIHQHLHFLLTRHFSSAGRQQEMDGGEATRLEARWDRPAPPPGRLGTPLGPI
jgi:hypothetical protein